MIKICNINLIYNKNKIKTADIPNLMNIMSFSSFKNNADGEGFLSLEKNSKKFKTGRNLKKFVFKEAESLLVTHQRLATKGKTEDNVHPHETESIILMHNGSFFLLGDTVKSDTKEYTEKFEEKYQENKKDIIKTIQDLSKEYGGTYSIVVYEKKTGKLFYYKESATKMFKLENENILIMSTSKDNLEYAKLFYGLEDEIKDVENYKIYDIINNFKEVGTFESKWQFHSNQKASEHNVHFVDSGWDSQEYARNNAKFDKEVEKRKEAKIKSSINNLLQTKDDKRKNFIKNVFKATICGHSNETFTIDVPKEYTNEIYRFIDAPILFCSNSKSIRYKLLNTELDSAIEDFNDLYEQNRKTIQKELSNLFD